MRQYCMTLTRIDSNNEEATMMLADMMFRSASLTIFHFQQLLQTRPDNYRGLYKLLQLLRRAGKIQEAKPFLEAAERHSPQSRHRAGYQFCKGMFARYTNEVADAIRSLNQARKSAEWGKFFERTENGTLFLLFLLKLTTCCVFVPLFFFA